MKRLLPIAAVLAIAVAKPELYREKEDFQYSRSSSDDGSKSGFYGAQRGNMGGNFERAHNMDGLAQHQMGGLVRQVQGELGEGSKTRTGSVFTAANSKGVYGSGNYDLSNLEGRNFQEGVSFDDTQPQSSLSSSHSNYNSKSSALSNSEYYSNGYQQNSRYHDELYGRSGQNSRHSAQNYNDNSAQFSGHSGQTANLQDVEGARGVKHYDYGGHATSGHYSQSGYHGQNVFGESQTNSHSSSDYGSNAQNRLIAPMPVKVVIKPGTKIPIPLATQTFDTEHNSHSAAFDQNFANNDAESLNNKNHRDGQAKYYESAYSYHKEWEKHDTKPVIIPTENPFPKNSELYEDNQAHTFGQQYDSTGAESQQLRSSNEHSNVKSTSSQYRHRSNDQEYKATSASTSNANTYTDYNSGVRSHENNQIDNTQNKPKSYQSSYSYHKSWERQGDPYIIKAVPGANTALESQRLTAASNNQGAWSTHQYGSRSQRNNQYYLNAEDCNCEDDSHIRVARSYNTDQQYQRDYDKEINQQGQNLAQQTQSTWGNLENLGQQTQNNWDKLAQAGQQTQWDNIESFGQQTQKQWDKLEDLGQQTQNHWNTFNEQQARPAQDMVEETQNNGMISPDQPVQPNFHQQTQNTLLSKTEQQAAHDLNPITRNTELYPDIKPQRNWNWHWNKPSEHELLNIPRDGSINNKYFENPQIQNNWFNRFYDDKLHYTSRQTTETSGVVRPSENFDSSDMSYFYNTPLMPQFVESDDMQAPGFTRFNEGSQLNDPFYNWINSNWNNETKHTVFNQHSQFHEHNYDSYGQSDRQSWEEEQQRFLNQYFQYYGNTFNSYGQLGRHNDWPAQTFFTSTETNLNNQNKQKPPPLSNLWNKVETIEEQSAHNIENSHNLTRTKTQHIDTNQNTTEYFSYNFNKSNNISPNLWHANSFKEESNSTNNSHKIANTDIGRGDISSEEQWDLIATDEKSHDIGRNEHNLNKFKPELEHKPYKTQSEIEALSQTLNTSDLVNTNQEQTDRPATFVTELKNQDSNSSNTGNSQYLNPQNTVLNFGDFKDPHEPTQKQNTETAIGNFNQQSQKFNDQSIDQQNTEQQFKTTRDSEDLNHQNAMQDFGNFEHPHKHTKKQDTEKPLEDFSQQSDKESIDQQNTQQFETIGESEDLKQQNAMQEFGNFDHPHGHTQTQDTQKTLEDFGQQSENFNQQSMDQQNTEQQFETIGGTEEFSQQNALQEFGNFEPPQKHPQTESNVKPLEDFGQFSENFNQQSTDQQNTEQQFETIGGTEDFNQQNALQEFGNFEHPQEHTQIQDTQKTLEDFGQQSENFNQQSMDQQNTEQQFETIGGTEEFSQQNALQEFGNFEPPQKHPQTESNVKPLEDFGQFSENFNQQSTDQQNTEQQFETIGGTEDFNQQNAMPEFGNFEHPQEHTQIQDTQKTLEDFGQQSENFNQQSMDQQNTDQQFETIGGTEEFNQQNALQEFGNFEPPQKHPQTESNVKPLEDFGQFSENFNQQSTDQQNTEQQFKTIGGTEDFNQQNAMQEFGNFEHPQEHTQIQDTQKTLEDFGQQSENFNQQSMDQQNTDQQFETIGGTEEFNQQNALQEFGNFEHPQKHPKTENNVKPLEDFSQLSENFNQQSMDQQNTEQQFETIGGTDGFNQQNALQEFGNFEHAHEHTQKQDTNTPLEDFGQQSEYFNQQSMDQQNTEQQFETIGGTEEFNQQNALQEFGKFEPPQKHPQTESNVKPLEDFGQQSENLNQQSTDQQNSEQQFETIGDTEDFNQQNAMQEFGNFEHPQEHTQKQDTNTEKRHEDIGQQRKNINQESIPIPVSSKPKDSEKTEDLENNEHRNIDSMTNTDIPPEESTEKPGFWKNIGNKFVSAKDKVFSWFKGS